MEVGAKALPGFLKLAAISLEVAWPPAYVF